MQLEILNENAVEFEGIEFSNCAFIKLVIDGKNLFEQKDLDRFGIVVWDEIQRTINESGRFLILTCVCGIADDAGYDFVDVERKADSVTWKFSDESYWDWEFSIQEYEWVYLLIEVKFLMVT